MDWYSLIFAAIVIEGLITYGKTLVVDHKIQWPVVASMGLGILCAVVFGIDLFAMAGIEATVPYVGMVLTGVLMSRGSNYLFDLFKVLTNIANGKTPTETDRAS